jgi:hypothetical protein
VLAIVTGTVRLVAVAAVGVPAVIPVPLNVTTDAAVKCVKLPVIVTARFVCPCWPVFGLTNVIAGVPFVTVKALASDTVSAPLTTWIPCAPAAAPAAIVTGTVRLVAVAAVGVPAVIPVPLYVTTDAVVKCVKFPLIVTDRLLCPCCPVFGFTCVIAGVPAVTVKALASDTVSGPVTTWIPCGPSGALPAIDTGTVRLVAVAAVGVPAVIPVPLKDATEPELKCVNCPVIVTVRALCPCCPLLAGVYKIRLAS